MVVVVVVLLSQCRRGVAHCGAFLITNFTLLFTALQDQMGRLENTALVGGERVDAAEHCLAGIARLSNEVKDASGYIPNYDQRLYAEVCYSMIVYR